MNIVCPRCNSPLVNIISSDDGSTPMYRCTKCGHKANLFPQMGNANKKVEEKGDEE